MAYRTDVLRRVGGFDERFPRAFREDADLALRVLDAGYGLVQGERRTQHPVRPAGWWASLHQQRGNADDVGWTGCTAGAGGAGPRPRWADARSTCSPPRSP